MSWKWCTALKIVWFEILYTWIKLKVKRHQRNPTEKKTFLNNTPKRNGRKKKWTEKHDEKKNDVSTPWWPVQSNVHRTAVQWAVNIMKYFSFHSHQYGAWSSIIIIIIMIKVFIKVRQSIAIKIYFRLKCAKFRCQTTNFTDLEKKKWKKKKWHKQEITFNVTMYNW